jgi:D-alanine-D-alanine ligase
MPNKSLRVAVVYNSHAPGEVDPDDRASYDDLLKMLRDICRTLRKLGHRPTLLGLGHDLIAFQRRLARMNPDVVFNQFEDTVPGATYEMRIAALVRMMGYPLTGSPALALGLTKSKYTCACLLAGAGVRIPRDTRLLHTVGGVDGHQWEFPVIVRPSAEDGGIGLDRRSRANSKAGLKVKMRELLKSGEQSVLVQRFLPGREFNVALLGGQKPVVLPLGEVDYTQLPSGIPPIMSYAAKWVETSDEYKHTRVICPAPVEEELAIKIRKTALQAFHAAGAWGYARVDIRIDEEGLPCVLEVNCNPCLERGIGLARSAEHAGLEYPALIQKILQAAFELHRHDSANLGGGMPPQLLDPASRKVRTVAAS